MTNRPESTATTRRKRPSKRRKQERKQVAEQSQNNLSTAQISLSSAHQPPPQLRELSAPACLADERYQAYLKQCWESAQARWSRFLLLRPPIDQPEQESIAQLDLHSRQISIHLGMILDKGLLSSMEALLAHELGHHVRYPGTMLNHLRLRLLEKSLLPYEHYSLVNLFTDLLINERIGRELRIDLIRIYKAFAQALPTAPPTTSNQTPEEETKPQESDPAFLFYLAIYEVLWMLPPGELMGVHYDTFVAQYPYHRADAQLLAQHIVPLGPNLFTQFLYFLSVLCRYIDHETVARGEPRLLLVPCDCGGGEGSPEDWAEALTPSAREREAIAKALREGWITEDNAEALGSLKSRISGLPGQGTHNAEQVPEIMAAYYRREAEKYLFRPPPQPSYGEAVVPTTLDAWEPGDAVKNIDWLTTFSQYGPELGLAMPQKREHIPELEGYELPMWRPYTEIYLDVSGSMPNPSRHRNAMTLAAQILTMATIRAGGWVRALLYSSDFVTYWEWCRSEIEISRFMMHYIGGGTTFPFGMLQRSVEECKERHPIRVVISDHDFEYNYDQDEQHASIFAEATRASAPMVLLLHLHKEGQLARYQAAGAECIRVHDMEDFPTMAAQLSRALFDQRTP